jgi:putative peptidoglycan lipid II flippase
LILVGKVLGFLREALISFRYGAGFVSDVYVLQDGVVNAINSVFANVLSSTFIPLYLGLRNPRERNRYISNIIAILSTIIILVISVCALFMEPILRVLVPGFYNIYDMSYVNFLMKIGVTQILLIFLENVLLALFQAHDLYLYTALQSVFLNVPLILYLIVGYQFEILGIIVCNLLANVGILLVLLTIMRKRKLAIYHFVFDLKDPNFRKTVRLSVPVLVVCLLSQFNYVVDRMMASTLDSGSMALISYSMTIGMLAYFVLGNAVSMPFYTAVSKVQDNVNTMMKVFYKYLDYLVRLLVPVCLALAFFSHEVSDIIYGRGKMTPQNIQIISVMVILYLPGTFFYCLRDMMNRICYAAKNTVIPSTAATVGFLANIVLILILVRHIGIYGVPLATSISSFLMFLFLIVTIRAKNLFHYRKIRLNLKRMVQFILMVTILYFGQMLFTAPEMGKFSEIIISGSMLLFAAGVYNFDLLIAYKKKHNGN